MLHKIKNWTGSRYDLIEKISSIEKSDTKKYGMYSKKTGNFLPVNSRRIQQFIDQGLILNPEVSPSGFVYNEDHIFRYFGAIFLRNSGHPMKQIIKIIQSYDTEDIKEKIIGSISDSKVTKNKFDNQIDYLKIDSNLPEKLKKLGRLEGRVLRSQWIRFAITSWVNVEVKKKELKSLSEEDIDTLCWAFMVSLRETVGLSKSNKLDRKIS